MRMNIPLTGTVIDFNPLSAELDGIGVSGDPNDPVRPIPLGLQCVNCRLISIDLENDLAEVEIIPTDSLSEDTGQVDERGDPIYKFRKATAQDKQKFLNDAKAMIEKTKDELYALSGSHRLIKQQKHVDAYVKLKKESK